MKEEKSGSKKKLFYYLALAACVLLLITATVLTVYFVAGGNRETIENPPVVDPDEGGGKEPEKPDEPTDPTGGEDVVKFVVPVAYESATTFNDFVWDVYGYTCHEAVDFSAAAGTEVRSMADGTVTSVSYNDVTGNIVVVDHGNGLKTLYRYVDPADGLKEGDTVKKGDKIGAVSTPYAAETTTPHLHLEVLLGEKRVNPADYIEIVASEK